MGKRIGIKLYICCFTQYKNKECYELSDDAYGENKVAQINVNYHDDGTKRAILESVDLIDAGQVKDIYDFMVKLEKNE